MFDEHIREMHTKAIKRLSALNRLANSAWGFESKILSTTVLALVESIVNFGLSVYGTHCSPQRAEAIDR